MIYRLIAQPVYDFIVGRMSKQTSHTKECSRRLSKHFPCGCGTDKVVQFLTKAPVVSTKEVVYLDKLVDDIFHAFEGDGWPGPDYIRDMIGEAMKEAK